MAWLIKYENDEIPSIKTFGTREDAETTARKRNKYNESYAITEAPRQDLTIECEQALIEAVKYGCSTDGMR